LHRFARIIVGLPVETKDNTTDAFALQGSRTLATHHATSQLDRFFADSMLIDDGGDDATKIIESKSSTLACNDVDALFA
jgi:hypothetical protein